MFSNNDAIRKLQSNLAKEITRAQTTYARKRERIRELYPTDAYGIKADMLIGDLDDKYGPMIREMKWYSQAIAELVEMKEGNKNEEVHV